MKNIWTLSGIFLAIAVSQSVFAAKKYPQVVNDAIADYADTCKSSEMGKLIMSKSFIRVADLTGDGIPDYILDEAEIRCTDAASIFTGNSGGSIKIFAGTKDGNAKKVFDDFKEGSTLKNNKLILDVRYAECGPSAPKPKSMVEDNGCLVQLDWNPNKQKMEFGKVIKMR